MYLSMLQGQNQTSMLFPGSNLPGFNQSSINSLLGLSGLPNISGVNNFGAMNMGQGSHQGASAASFHQPAEKN
jgi:hypothetical protein